MVTDSSLAQVVFLLSLQACPTSQDEEARTYVSHTFLREKQAPPHRLALPLSVLYLLLSLALQKLNSEGITADFWENQRLRRQTRPLLVWQKGSYSFVKVRMQMQCWHSFHPVLLLMTVSFCMPPCSLGGQGSLILDINFDDYHRRLCSFSSCWTTEFNSSRDEQVPLGLKP